MTDTGRHPGGGATAGPVRFARYAYPPNALGYCGPDDAAELLGLASEAGDRRGLAHLAARFEGAWPYLQLIAACNAIGDPLDERVVEAYWIGNELLDRVPSAVLLASVRERFGRRAGRDVEHVAAAVALGAGAHHSFHVFGVYPWVGLLRAGRHHPSPGDGAAGAALQVLERCRIRWGTVVSVQGDVLVARSRGLRLDGQRLTLGAERIEQVRRSTDGTGLLGPVAPGDTVSMHWDWACERLSPLQAARLRATTARTLRGVNAAPVPGPAVACERLGA